MANEDYQTARGTRDVLAPESWQFEALRRIALDWARRFGYDLIETPIFEKSPVFLKVGESTDIVQHESYRFRDAGGDDLTLRPEGTAAVARAYVQHGLAQAPQPVRLCYVGPMFRRERPQAGRYRQHSQFGAEIYGSDSPLADAEVMLLAVQVVDAAGLRHPVVRVNSIGCDICRPRYRQALIDYFESRRGSLCRDCQTRLEQNPLRLLDCKIDVDIKAGAPDLKDFWCEDCQTHIEHVVDAVQAAGIEIHRDRHLVRGLDYYTRTVFEVGHPSLGDQVALFGGGRYDGLSGRMGGPSAPAVGFGMGLERLLSALPEPLDDGEPRRIYVAHLPSFEDTAYELAMTLRRQGLAADADVIGRSLKAQLKDANRRASWVVIVGGQEWENGTVSVRNLATGSQELVSRDQLVRYLGDQLQEAKE